MASKQVPDLPDAGPATGTEWLHVVQTGNSRRLTIAGLIALVIDASPATLDTLNELAAALGDDPNFATTVLNALADKAPVLLVPSSINVAAYAIAAGDKYAAKILEVVDTVITIPLNATAAVPIGARIRFTDVLGGASFAAAGGVTVIPPQNGGLNSAGAGATFEAWKIGADRWVLLGELTA